MKIVYVDNFIGFLQFFSNIFVRLRKLYLLPKSVVELKNPEYL